MNTLVDLLALKMQEFTEAETKRESVLESMQFTLDQEKTRFNHSIGLILENLTIQSNKTWQEFILKQQKGKTNFTKFFLQKKRKSVSQNCDHRTESADNPN